jgi:membrane-bound metal-dependent hydrolase YbcI (DUF457 family)
VPSVPVTPLHYPIAKIINKLDKTARLSLPALIVGSMVPDLEVPFVYFLSGTWMQDRMVLHSLIGGLTIGTVITIIITVLAYPRVISAFFPNKKERVKKKCSLTRGLFFSSLIGVLSHVLLDVANHAYNPLFWPFISLDQTPSPIVPFLGGSSMASLIIGGIMLLLFIPILIDAKSNFWERLLVG